mmetsp:Transcript_25912/g.50740  ORF Transcript_25912/g.50740 Transcript_25912/m.50740 type:complete len:129 (-) Transcript_25912:90-476(-)
MQFTALICLVLTSTASALLTNSSKLDINQKVSIEGIEVLGDSAGEALLNECTQFAQQFIDNAAGPAIEVCGTGIKVSIWLRSRCVEYSKYTETVGACDKSQPASTCVTKSPSTVPVLGHFQSYKIEQC